MDDENQNYHDMVAKKRAKSERYRVDLVSVVNVDQFDKVWVLDHPHSMVEMTAVSVGKDNPLSTLWLEKYPILGIGYVVDDLSTHAIVCWRPKEGTE